MTLENLNMVAKVLNYLKQLSYLKFYEIKMNKIESFKFTFRTKFWKAGTSYTIILRIILKNWENNLYNKIYVTFGAM